MQDLESKSLLENNSHNPSNKSNNMYIKAFSFVVLTTLLLAAYFSSGFTQNKIPTTYDLQAAVLAPDASGPKSTFSIPDTNSDGVISPEEVKINN